MLEDFRFILLNCLNIFLRWRLLPGLPFDDGLKEWAKAYRGRRWYPYG